MTREDIIQCLTNHGLKHSVEDVGDGDVMYTVKMEDAYNSTFYMTVFDDNHCAFTLFQGQEKVANSDHPDAGQVLTALLKAYQL